MQRIERGAVMSGSSARRLLAGCWRHARWLCLAWIGLAGVTGAVQAEEGYAWDRFPQSKMTDVAALQNGAHLFVNYCLNCHAASYMRYNRLRDIGLTEAEIKANLMFATEKVGDTMKVSMDAKQAKDWFGAQPPDLTVITRSRSGERGSGADYVYTYLRSYYRDPTRATGWNNLAYPNVAMPNVLWQLQGQRSAKFVDETDEHDPGVVAHRFEGFETASPGTMSSAEFDNAVGDLVAYLQWMGEPSQGTRLRVGVWVLMFLGVLTVIAWRLNAAYWSEIK